MGTFHDNLGPLHGITVLVEMRDGSIHIGRCHTADDKQVILLDADTFHEDQSDLSREQYLANAARWGVFKKHDYLTIAIDGVESVQPLGEFSVG